MTERISIRRVIAAGRDRVFAAWTQPELLRQWWGPVGVKCIDAEIDLRVGGAYRIANQTPDGVVWITGVFELVDAPNRLVYSWTIGDEPTSRVSVQLVALDERSTEIVIEHDRIHSREAAEGHARGWVGCLDGLERFA